MSNSIKKIQSMIAGERKIQVGAEPKTIEQRKEDEVWTEASLANPRGAEWTKKSGKRVQITKMPGRGLDTCHDCKKLILKKRDQDTYIRMQRCYICQIDFENDLKTKNKWKDWVMGLETQRWETIEKELAEIMKEMAEQSDKQFDPTIAYAIGNEEQAKNRRNIAKETR
tara:strand:- start:300 stop:806 length:507 start_codon:yes stop_codon:yes gene_type:complete